MKKTLFIGLALLSVAYANAQIEQFYGRTASDRISLAKEVAVSSDHEEPIFIEFKDDAQLTESELENYLKQQLNADQEISLVERNLLQDELGFLHRRYYQFYQGKQIEMAWLVSHSKNGEVKSVNGNIVAKPRVVGTNSIGESVALQNALNDLNAEVYKWEVANEERQLKFELDDPDATYYPRAELVWMNSSLDIHSTLKLCYRFNIYAQKPLGRYNYYVDATDGSIVYVESMLHTTDKPGTAHTGYSGVRTIITDSVSNYYRLRESGRGNGIETYNMNNTTTYSSATDFIDSNNIWNSFQILYDRYATDAHFGTEKTYDYFSIVHNRNSIDNNGFALRSYVRYGTNYVNAFWDGQRMTYGDGDNIYSPLTTLDICGHEVVHGLTDYTSDLIYANESGALNESFSDIFGVCVEQFARPNNWNWLIGEDIGGAFRTMSDPNRNSDPDTYGGAFWVNQNCIPTSGNDRCGVHTNSGVQNYWFYLLTAGGSGTNDIGDPFFVNGLGILNAAKIAYRNNTVYLGRSSNFAEARFYGIRSAIDLYGACSPEVQQVTNAWYAVGVGAPYQAGVSADFVAKNDTSFCQSPASVQFDSDGRNALSFRWNFGDGRTSTLADPTHTYNRTGNFTIQLIADGGACGSDTLVKQNYIRVDTGNIRCSYYLGSTRSVNDCSGNLYDNGGLNGNYAVNSRDTITISVPTADRIVYYIQDFDLQSGDQSFCNYDYLEIYDGKINDALIGKYCGNNLPPDSILSSGNQLTLIFSSDQRVSRGGIKSYWQCKSATALPVADFYSPLDTTCSAQVAFVNNSRGVVNSWFWDFGDGKTSTQKNPVHFYENDGSYTVSLRVSNSLGSDQVVKSNVVTVSRLPQPVVSNDTVCLNESVKLGAGGAGKIEWYDQKAGGNLRFIGDTLRFNRLSRDTSFFVQYTQRPAAISGPFLINGNGYFSDSSEAMYFDVYEPLILESVILNSNRLAVRRIELRNSAGKILQTRTIQVSGVPQQVQIGFVIYPGTNYSLSIGSPNPSLYMNSTGATYPYNLGNLMSLTGNSLDPNAYPFFYYWTVRPLSCFSARARVGAKVDTNCVITSLKDAGSAEQMISIFPNPSQRSFFLDNPKGADLELMIYNLEGKLLKIENVRGNGTSRQEYGADLPAAIYLINIRSEEESKQFKWVKTQ